MSDFTIKSGRPRTRRADPTADEIFRVPSVEEVAAAGYPDPAAFRESIRVRFEEHKQRFATDAAFRAEVTAEYQREHRTRRGRR